VSGQKLSQNIFYPHTGPWYVYFKYTHKRFPGGQQISPRLDTATGPCTYFPRVLSCSSCALTSHDHCVPTGVNMCFETDIAILGVLWKQQDHRQNRHSLDTSESTNAKSTPIGQKKHCTCACPIIPPPVHLNTSTVLSLAFNRYRATFNQTETVHFPPSRPRQSARWPVHGRRSNHTECRVGQLLVLRRDEEADLWPANQNTYLVPVARRSDCRRRTIHG